MSTQIKKTKKFEFDAVLQDIHRRDKGSKNCKDPHTSLTLLTRPITNDEMDKIVYGGCFGAKVHVVIEVLTKEEKSKT